MQRYLDYRRGTSGPAGQMKTSTQTDPEEIMTKEEMCLLKGQERESGFKGLDGLLIMRKIGCLPNQAKPLNLLRLTQL